jgi:16S rRNA (adenine1518-N6/adenine1519-N6)-dimethyltransferase
VPKKLGQHFLVDGAYAARTVRALRVTGEDNVVEIGPGRGVLTHLLVQARPKSLTLVELDGALAQLLRERFAGQQWISVTEDDARTVSPDQLLAGATGRYKVIGNLPYYAASPIIRNLLESSRPPSLLVVMVQREVAAGMAAQAGKMSLLSVGVQLFADAEVLFDVPPSAFRPPPKVTSSVVRLTVLPAPRLQLDATASFFELVRAGFRAPRKQIRNSLAHGLGVEAPKASEMLDRAEIEATRRPETLSLDEWGQLYRAWRAAAAAPGSTI